VVVYGTDTIGNFSPVAGSDDTGQFLDAFDWLVGDFTGSGTSQIAQLRDDDAGRLALNLYAAISGAVIVSSFDLGPYAGVSALLAGDFTGSGRTQIARHFDDGHGGVELAIYGFDDAGRFGTIVSSTDVWKGSPTKKWLTGDFTGSGRTELSQLFDVGQGQL